MDEIVRQLRAAGCVFAEEEAELLRRAAATDEELAAMTGRRAAGEPLEYVVGWAPFLGLDIRVVPGVFIPRRRTEFLATEAIRRCDPGAVVLDMCCGTGAIGAAIAAKVPLGELHATDVDPVATACARQNVPGTVYAGDLFASLPASLRGRVDVLVVNPPYVPSAQVPLLPAEARDHEPLSTLDGGTDGLGVLRRVLADAGKWLTPGGFLLAETSDRQTGSALESIASAGLDGEVLTDPDLEATLVTGRSRLGDNTAELPHNRGIWGWGDIYPDQVLRLEVPWLSTTRARPQCTVTSTTTPTRVKAQIRPAAVCCFSETPCFPEAPCFPETECTSEMVPLPSTVSPS